MIPLTYSALVSARRRYWARVLRIKREWCRDHLKRWSKGRCC